MSRRCEEDTETMTRGQLSKGKGQASRSSSGPLQTVTSQSRSCGVRPREATGWISLPGSFCLSQVLHPQWAAPPIHLKKLVHFQIKFSWPGTCEFTPSQWGVAAGGKRYSAKQRDMVSPTRKICLKEVRRVFVHLFVCLFVYGAADQT